jgi:hypothetical protein
MRDPSTDRLANSLDRFFNTVLVGLLLIGAKFLWTLWLVLMSIESTYFIDAARHTFTCCFVCRQDDETREVFEMNNKYSIHEFL